MGNALTSQNGGGEGDGGGPGAHGATGIGGDVDFIQRLSNDDRRRYTEGFRRICRGGSNSSSSSSNDAVAGTSVPLPPPPPRSRSVPAPTARGSGSGSGIAPATTTMTAAVPDALSKKLFRSKLLGAFPLIPHSLSDRLFEVLDDRQQGELTVESVLRGLALLKHGTLEEHTRLLFTIYDLDGTGLVARDVLNRFMDVIYGRQRARHPRTVAFLDRLFAGRKTLTPEEFQCIADEREDTGDTADEGRAGQALLMHWLTVLAARIGEPEEPRILELERQYNPVVIRHRIAESTRFSVLEVTALDKQFHKLFDTKGGASNRIPSAQFEDILGRHGFPRDILERVCRRSAIRGMVLFDEFCTFLSNFCRGSQESKSQHLFALFAEAQVDDVSGTMPVLTKTGFRDLEATCTTARQCESEVDESLDGVTDKDMNDCGGTRESWTLNEFVVWASQSFMVQQLLHQIAFAACILFGIKPDSALLEKRIIVWHWKQASKVFEVGQTWNFIATKWWEQWCRYAGLDIRNGSHIGSLRIPHIPTKAITESDNATIFPQQSDQEGCNRPGPIANWSLLKRSGSRRLKDSLRLKQDFHLIPASVYSILTQWYSGGPDLSRTIIELPNSVLQLELFPLVLRVARVDSSNGGVIMSGEEVILSSLSTVESILHASCKALLLVKHVERARLWYFDEAYPDHKYRLSPERAKDLAKLTQSSVFLLEIQDDDGSWPLSQSNDSVRVDDDGLDGSPSTTASSQVRKRPREMKPQSSPQRRTSDICSRGSLESLTTLGAKNSPNVKRGSSAGAAVVEEEGLATARTLKRRFSQSAFTGSGLVGLDNLGNTCYMSSALQCLSHTRFLVDYFKNQDYLHDINLHNRDGTNGKLAVAFGELLRVLWTSDKKRLAPTEFKRVLSRFNPQFTGSDQHDAQELLACLLSSLSEDLNRIVSKPYIEQPDSNGRCDAIVANEWWENHLKREMSVIVALFTGQYKSLLECSVCHYESARFEPFTFLQLSLPESNFRSIVVTVIFNCERVPMKYSVRVRNNGVIQDVVDEVVDLIRRMDKRDGIERDKPAEVVIARVSLQHTIDALLDVKTSLMRVHERDQLTAFQLDHIPDDTYPQESLSLAEFVQDPDTPQSPSSENATQDETITTESPSSRASSPTESERQTVISEHDPDAQNPDGNGDAENCDHGPLPLGTSVYTRVEKSKDFLAARVIGGNSVNCTVDVAYPSGVRRYHIPRSKVVERRSDEAFIFLVHRRVERSVNAFTDAHITRLFGAPLILRVSFRVSTTYELYMLVWRRLHRIFNWDNFPPVSDFTGKQGKISTCVDTTTDITQMALGEHLNLTKFGFTLRMVTSLGIGCSRCEWIKGCLGCLITPSVSERIDLAAEETISIDWDIRTLKEEYDPIQASKLDTHETVQINHRLDNMPLNIHRCLDIFTARESIQEAYCGRCKTHGPATKTMDLWRLPPILVIQLKRFCFTQTSRRKLHHFVDFPLSGLRLDDFVAKKRTPKRIHETGLVYWQFLGGKLACDLSINGTCANLNTSGDIPPTSPKENPSSPTALLAAPAAAALPAETAGQYDLYAVINHVGALGGGHYFAYILSEEDDKWKCFNDHQCKDIDAKEVVSSSAYILFYRRRDVKDVAIEDLFPPIRRSRGQNEADDARAEADQAKVEELVEQTKLATNSSGCVIS